MAYVKDEHGTEWLYEPFSTHWQWHVLKLPEDVQMSISCYPFGHVDVIRLKERARTIPAMRAMLANGKAPIMGELQSV